MTRRIVVTGPESTGKTTLAAALAAEFHAPWLTEAAREFAESHPDVALSAATVEPIARLAMAAQEAALAAKPPVLVLDTDLISTVVYARHYYGACPEWVVREARARRGDDYLLCDIDLPWKADGVRDRPVQRTEMLQLFRATLAEFGCEVADVRGTGDARQRFALAAITRSSA